MHSVRTSCAIALFRKPDEKENYWKLLVGKRRHTMFLNIFLYNVLPTINKIKSQELINVFDNLSVNEKNIILSNNVETICNYVNYNSINNKIYGDFKDIKQDVKQEIVHDAKIKALTNKIKKNYNKATSDEVNLRKIATAISSSKKYSEPEWVIPRGKRDNNEELLNCAIRELKEETGIGPDSYTILYSEANKFVYYDNYMKNKYEIIYFVAIENVKTVPRIVSPREIVELQFIPVHLLGTFIQDKNAIAIINKMYKYIKKYKNASKRIFKEESDIHIDKKQAIADGDEFF
jgi:8-oxo-dGTP pyrophosphatase MutT (NUDIX family)